MSPADGASVPRRAALRAIGIGALALAVPSCSRKKAAERHVTLYSSADDEILKQIVAAFEKQSGITVGVVTDTEATKTTGLVQRLLDEKDRPRADVWWSSEPLGTIRLAREGVLVEYTPGEGAAGRPAALNARAMWFVMPQRARVIAFSTKRVQPADAPRTLRDLALPAWNDRVGMARPQFGTTRSHMTAIVALAGEQPARRWLVAMKANGVRLYDGNAAVVRAIAQGEIDAGLTDTDDVHAARRNAWEVGMNFEAHDEPGEDFVGLPSFGTIVLPNTAALVAHGPHPKEGASLLEFLLSQEVERALAAGESAHTPLRESIVREFPANQVPSPAPLSIESMADAVPIAMRLCDDVLGR